jgi:hypothetical protein
MRSPVATTVELGAERLKVWLQNKKSRRGWDCSQAPVGTIGALRHKPPVSLGFTMSLTNESLPEKADQAFMVFGIVDLDQSF